MIRDDIDLSVIRRAKDLSQAQLAEKVGVSQATISRIEKREYQPSLQLAVKIARALDYDLRGLLHDETLKEAVSQSRRDKFFAFCPNPFCDRNQYGRGQDGQIFVSWKSGEGYPSSRYQEVNFCTHCGTDLAKECAACGHQLEERTSRFCISCGSEITTRPTTEEWKRIEQLVGKAEEDDVPF